MSNVQALASALSLAALEKKIARAAKGKNGRAVLLSEEEAESIYDLPGFNGHAESLEKLRGWIMHGISPKAVQVAMDRRPCGQYVLWGM